jgi:hypothetical protein
MEDQFVTIVSGLPRSGTSMMMRMLDLGGMPVLVDHIRIPDEDNPRGYYEFERVKQVEHDQAWLEEAQGRVVKMIAALVKKLPPEYSYRIVFMRRKIEEVLASQRQMLIRRGEPTDTIGDEEMAALFSRHVEQVEAWLETQPHMKVLYVDYGDVLADPRTQAERINHFLGGRLDTAAMAGAVDPSLYRQRQ